MHNEAWPKVVMKIWNPTRIKNSPGFILIFPGEIFIRVLMICSPVYIEIGYPLNK